MLRSFGWIGVVWVATAMPLHAQFGMNPNNRFLPPGVRPVSPPVGMPVGPAYGRVVLAGPLANPWYANARWSAYYGYPFAGSFGDPYAGYYRGLADLMLAQAIADQ